MKKTYVANVTMNGQSSDFLNEMFKDGRNFSAMGENIAKELFDLTDVDNSCNKDFDFLMGDKRVEVKTLTKNGLKTAPSRMFGAGRTYNEKEHLEVLTKNDFYIIVDNTKFPNIDLYLIPSNEKLLFSGLSYKKAKILVENLS